MMTRRRVTPVSVRKQVLALALLVAVAWALGLWNGRGTTSGRSLSAREWLDRVQVSYRLAQDINELMLDTDAIVLFRVDGISAPLWNSTRGTMWGGSSTVRADVLSRVSGHVVENLHGAAPRSPIQLLVSGDASLRYEGFDIPGYAALSGGFIQGQTFVLLLKRASFSFEGGRVAAWTLSHDFQGNWRVHGEQAVASYSRYSMPLHGLRVALGRAWGRVRGTSS